MKADATDHVWQAGQADKADYQRRIYSRGMYANNWWRKIRWLFRYDCRYRLLLMEELFRRHQIPFEHQKVFELGFGTGDLLFRFDSTSTLHGCEVTAEAVEAIENDERLGRYTAAHFTCSEQDGSPVFPADDYDVIIAAHVLEHVPNDAAMLRALASRARPGGHGLFFLPLERPGHLPKLHARTYTAAGFTRLVKDNGWDVVEVSENFRYAGHLVQVVNWPSRHKVPVIGKLVEGIKNFAMGLPPTTIIRLVEEPLERLHVAPRQLMLLARRPEKTKRKVG